MRPPDLSRLLDLRSRNRAARDHLDTLRPRFARLAGRADNGSAPEIVVAHQLFQTPPELAARMAALAGIKPGLRVLEPSAGLGRLLDAIMNHQPGEVVVVDIAPQCANVLARRGDCKVVTADFLDCDPFELGLFDVVVMNPPFTMRSDVRHIQHAATFIRTGGTLVALCMDTDQREAALMPLAKTWEKIPAGTFAKEGTNIATVLMTA